MKFAIKNIKITEYALELEQRIIEWNTTKLEKQNKMLFYGKAMIKRTNIRT